MITLIVSDCCRKPIEGCGCGNCLSARTCSRCKQPCNIWDKIEVENCEHCFDMKVSEPIYTNHPEKCKKCCWCNEDRYPKKECCVCGEEAKHKCRSCEMDYCSKCYEATVMTGNCCTQNEKDYSPSYNFYSDY